MGHQIVSHDKWSTYQVCDRIQPLVDTDMSCVREVITAPG